MGTHYEEEGIDSSDDEMPEEVSNATMKTNYDHLSKQVESLKQQMKEAQKGKRRRKQEMFETQKLAKLSKLPVENNEAADSTSPANRDQVSHDSRPKVKPTRKVYPTLNITVEPLTKTNDGRATAALDFKSRRLAKVHRESVKTAVISYQKKLQARRT